MTDNMSFVMLEQKDGDINGDQKYHSSVIAGQVLTAQENQVYETVMKVVKQKEMLQNSIQENYKQLLTRVEQVKKFKENQEEIQKRLNENLTKEREKNKILESKLHQSEKSIQEWRESISHQLDNLKEKVGENPFRSDGTFEEEEVEICRIYNDLTQKDENHSYILVTGIENQKDIRARYNEFGKFFSKLESLKSHSKEAEDLWTSTVELRDTWKDAEINANDTNKVDFEEFVNLKTEYDKLLEERLGFSVLKENYECLNLEYEKNMDENKQMRAELTEAKERLESIQNNSYEIPVKDKEKDDLKAEIEKLKSQIISLKGDLDETTVSYEKADEKCCELEDKIKSINNQLAHYKTQNEQLNSKLEMQSQQLNVERLLKEKDNEIEEMMQTLRMKTQEVEKVTKTNDVLRKRDDANTARLDDLVGKYNILKSESNPSLVSLQSDAGYDLCNTATRPDDLTFSKPVPKPRGVRKSTTLLSDDELPSSLENDSINSEKENKALREEIDTLKGEIDTLKMKIEELTAENKELVGRTNENSGLGEEVEDWKENVENLSREKTELLERNNYIESELEKLRNELKLERQNTFSRDEEKNAEVLKLETKCQDLEKTLKTQQTYIGDYEARIFKEKEDKQKFYRKVQTLMASSEEVGKIKIERDNLIHQNGLLNASLVRNVKESDILQSNLKRETERLQGDIETHKYQIQVFQADFEAERAARERQVEELNAVKEERNRYRMVYERMKEEEKRNEQQNFANIRQKHASPVYSNYQSMNPVASGQYQQPRNLYRDPYQQQQQQHQQQQQQQHYQQQHYQQQQQPPPMGDASQNTEVAHRPCPKCQKKFPDIETLEIHLMDCLDD